MSLRKMLLVGGLAALLVVSGVAWLHWSAIRGWHVLRGLKNADEASLPHWVDQAVACGPQLIGPLVQGLTESDNCAEALSAMASQWGASDERTASIGEAVVNAWPTMLPRGKERALRVLAGCTIGPSLREACVRILDDASGDSLEPAMALAAKLLPDSLPAARRLAKAGLSSSSEEARVQAILLCQRQEIGLFDEVVRRLKAGTPAERRATVMAIGPSDAHENALLACLHDDDSEVRRLASAALQGRGLKPEQVELGRLVTHAESRSRLLVLDKLREVADVDPEVWIRRLSHDHSPAVRAAALRIITEQMPEELGARVEEMARTDPSPTVSQLARYYLGTRPGVLPVGGRR